MSDWRDRLASHRMQVDRQFADRVRDSALSRQQWALVMTAVEFDVVDADDESRAHLVADTSGLEHVLPEMGDLPHGNPTEGGDGDGFLDDVKDALGLGEGESDVEREAEELAEEYARTLETHLRNQSRWDEIRRAAARE